MGKSKASRANNVKNNIFKVAGCKSLKSKNKAKAVTHERTKSVSWNNTVIPLSSLAFVSPTLTYAIRNIRSSKIFVEIKASCSPKSDNIVFNFLVYFFLLIFFFFEFRFT